MTKFSLVVPTLGRTNELADFLNSLVNQSFDDFEVLIVDQNQSDLLDEIVSGFDKLRITHIRQEEKGASKARNAGLARAQGEIVTFPDDDCEYPPDLLERVAATFEAKPELDAITVNSKDIYQGGSIGRLSKRSGEVSKINILSRLVEFTIFVRRDAVGQHRFNENLGPGAVTNLWCDEGPDFLLALIYEGKRIGYFADIVIHHPNQKKVFNEKSFLRSYNYGLARGYFLKKHNYPIWYVLYVWGKYVVGSTIAIVFLQPKKAKFYLRGLSGRIKGYYKKIND